MWLKLKCNGCTYQLAQLQQVTSKTCLGIIIDGDLNFKEQVDIISPRAYGALSKLSSLIPDKSGISMKIALQQYTSYVRPVLEGTFPVWCAADSRKIPKLDI